MRMPTRGRRVSQAHKTGVDDDAAHAAALGRSRAGRARRADARQPRLGRGRRPPRAEDFYRRDHQLIFEAIAELAARSEPADAVTLSEYLEAKGLARGDRRARLSAGLARDTPTAANVRAYAEIVRERSMLRQLISVGGEIAASAYDSEGRVGDRARRRGRAARVRDRRARRRSGLRLHPAARRARRDDRPPRHAAPDAGRSCTGVSTGFTELDEMTAGCSRAT